jgi:hypothetical protein
LPERQVVEPDRRPGALGSLRGVLEHQLETAAGWREHELVASRDRLQTEHVLAEAPLGGPIGDPAADGAQRRSLGHAA